MMSRGDGSGFRKEFGTKDKNTIHVILCQLFLGGNDRKDATNFINIDLVNQSIFPDSF